MRVRVLGPLEVLGRSGWEPPSALKRRQVLAVLALSPGDGVSADRIIDALWGDAPPRSAPKIVQNQVLGLRNTYGASLVTSVPGGYALTVDEEATDARRFESLARSGCAALEAARLADALAALDEALGLWRGPPFADIDDWSSAVAEITRLDELRRGAVENRLDALVAAGEHASSIADLESAVAAEPLRERRWELLMVALYRSGRQAEALRAFQRARTMLLDELGIEPGPALRDLDRAIAVQDDSLGGPPSLATTASPRQLVAEVRRATAQRLAGDDRYRVTIHRAARRALDAGDDAALASAAVAGVRRAGARASGAVDEELVELLEHAITRAPDDPARARLLSALGQELAASGDRARLRTLSDDALAAARRTGDAAVISEVLARERSHWQVRTCSRNGSSRPRRTFASHRTSMTSTRRGPRSSHASQR
jgi:DNA-binding SARP family transcriptional activator